MKNDLTSEINVLEHFNDWIEALKVVIENDGYEENEFEVFADHWRPYYKDGYTPTSAWHKVTKQGIFHNG